MTADEAEALIAEWFRTMPHPGFESYGYDLYIPSLIRWHLDQTARGADGNVLHQRNQQWSPVLALASWELARRGFLRPGVKVHDGQSTPDGCAGYGFSITPTGLEWTRTPDPHRFLPSAPGRFAELLAGFRPLYGDGFHVRSQEAIQCFRVQAYLACCTMCGAAAESILLATAIRRTGDEAVVLADYRASGGRGRIRALVVGAAPSFAQRSYDASMNLLGYWRDEAAHGAATSISDVEAETALVTLARYATFTRDNWALLTGTT